MERSGPRRLDVNVAGAQVDGLLHKRVERAHHGGAAGEIAQIVEALLLRRAARRRLARLLVARAGLERAGDILERGDDDAGGAVQRDLGRAQSFRVGGIGHRDADAALDGRERKERGLAQEAFAEAARQRGRRHHLRQRHKFQAKGLGDLFGEIMRRQIARLKHGAQRQAAPGSGLLDARAIRNDMAARGQRRQQL